MVKKWTFSGFVFVLLAVLLLSVTGFAADAPAPREYVFFVDISESVNRDGFASAKAMMADVANDLTDGESISVYTFASELTKVLDGCTDAEEACAVIETIELVPGNTRFYKSMIEAFAQDENAVCFVISDGVECHDGEPAVNSLEEVLAAKEESTVPVYGLCSDSIAESDYAEFKTLTEDSGGFRLLSNDEMRQFAATIIEESRIEIAQPTPEPPPEPTPEPTPEPATESIENTDLSEPETAEPEPSESAFPIPILIGAVVAVGAAVGALIFVKKKKTASAEPSENVRKKAETPNVMFYFDEEKSSDE